MDKTDLVYRLVTTTKTCFLSRPRRFGKSLLVSTLDAYFKGRKELFDGLMIAKLEKDWHQYPVFKIDFNGVNFTEKGNLEATIEYYLANWEKIYGRNSHQRFHFPIEYSPAHTHGLGQIINSNSEF